MTPRDVPEREFAVAILLSLAECRNPHFSPLGFYDDDVGVIEDIATRLGLDPSEKAFDAKLRRALRRMVSYGVLYRRQRGTGKEYLGEPAVQSNYHLDRGYMPRLAPHCFKDYAPMAGATPRIEALFLLRHAYPET